VASQTRRAAAANPVPRLRRAYYDCRFGQLHLHNAIPAGGGFDELTSVICLHGTGESGRVFMSLLAALGSNRSVYAPDLPGAGESDPAPGIEPLAAATLAVGDFIDSMRIRRFDLVARESACAAARVIARERAAAVRRVVLLGEPAGRALESHPGLSVPADLDPGQLADRIAAFLAE
jgi:pimeloyl-ACP methyl ester carboxylesterase